MTEALEPNQPTPPGAMCGAHPERAAVITCARCGDFACGDCALRGLCTACAERSPYVLSDLDRDNWRVRTVFKHARATLNDRSTSTLGMFWALVIPVLLVMTAAMLVAMPGFLSGKIDAKASYSLSGRLIMQGASLASLLLVSPLLLGLFAYVLGRAVGRKPGFAIVRDQLPRVPQFAVVLLAVLPVTIVLALLQGAPDVAAVTPRNPFAAFSVRNTLLSLLIWPVMLLQYSAFFEVVLDHDVDGLQALRRAAKVLSYRPVVTLWAAFLVGLVAMVSMSCCFIPAIWLWPFSMLAFATLYLAARTPASG